MDSVGAWLGPSRTGGKQLGTVKAALAAGATLMRLLTLCATELDASVLSEEQVERAVSVCVSCLVDNALLPGMSTGTGASTSGGGNTTAGGVSAATKSSDKGGRKSNKSGASSSSALSEMGEEDEDYVEGKEGKAGSGVDKDNLEAMVTVGKSKFKVKQTTRRLLAEVNNV